MQAIVSFFLHEADKNAANKLWGQNSFVDFRTRGDAIYHLNQKTKTPLIYPGDMHIFFLVKYYSSQQKTYSSAAY